MGQWTPPTEGKSGPKESLALAKRPGQVDTRGMYDSQYRPEPVSLAPDKRILLLAICAPFAAIALLASPLLIGLARQAAGI